MRLSLSVAGLLSIVTSAILAGTAAELGVYVGQWWKNFLSSPDGNSWFDSWFGCAVLTIFGPNAALFPVLVTASRNKTIQAKLEQLADIVEAEQKPDPFRVLMAGDSTMKHQFGAICGFLGEREGRRFDPMEKQARSPGCCVDTAKGGGRGLCFEFDEYRFLNPEHAGGNVVDAYYFGCGLHILHVTPERPLEPLRTQEWLAYEALLEDQVRAIRAKNGEYVRIVFMTTHVVDDRMFGGAFAEIRDAYRVGGGNQTIRDACEAQLPYALTGSPGDVHYWEGRFNLSRYTKVGEGNFNTSSYCSEALMDRRGSVQLSRRARPVMARLGVPIVDAGRIVEGQEWATHVHDGRHYHPIVPLELMALLEVLTSPPPPPYRPEEGGEGPIPLEDEHHYSSGSPSVQSFELHGNV